MKHPVHGGGKRDTTMGGIRELRANGRNAMIGKRVARLYLVMFLVWLTGVTVALLILSRSLGFRRYLLSLDFRAFYTGGRMALEGVGAGLYDLPTQYRWQSGFAPELGNLSDLYPFFSPPFVAVPLMLPASLPYESAYIIWGVLNIALMALICSLLVSMLAEAGQSAQFRALELGLTFLPVWVTIAQGQVSFILVLALLLGWRALRSGKDWQAGLGLALLLARPQLVIVPALILVWKRRLRALAGLALGTGILMSLSWLLVGWQGLLSYGRLLVSAFTWGNAYALHPQRMHTWRGFLHLLLGTDDPAQVQIWWLVGVAMAIGLLLWAWRRPWDARSPRFDLQWSFLVLVTLFTSPHLYSHDLSLLVVPGALVARYLAAQPSRGLRHRLLALLLPLGYLMPVATLLWAIRLRLQFSVLFYMLAIFILLWALGQVSQESAVETI